MITFNDYPHVTATDAEGVTYGSMRIINLLFGLNMVDIS